MDQVDDKEEWYVWLMEFGNCFFENYAYKGFSNMFSSNVGALDRSNVMNRSGFMRFCFRFLEGFLKNDFFSLTCRAICDSESVYNSDMRYPFPSLFSKFPIFEKWKPFCRNGLTEVFIISWSLGLFIISFSFLHFLWILQYSDDIRFKSCSCFK